MSHLNIRQFFHIGKFKKLILLLFFLLPIFLSIPTVEKIFAQDSLINPIETSKSGDIGSVIQTIKQDNEPSKSAGLKKDQNDPLVITENNDPGIVKQLVSSVNSLVSKVRGVEEEIDPALSFQYKYPLANGTNVHFQQKGSKRPGFAVAGRDNKHVLEFLLKNYQQTNQEKQKVTRKKSNVLEFPVTISGIPMTLRYTSEPNKVKEEFIIAKKPDAETLKNLGDHLAVDFDFKKGDLEISAEGGSYTIRSKEGDVNWQLPQPIVTDNAGSEFMLEMDISQSQTASIKVPVDFLNNASYPVIIDPTVITSSGSQPTKIGTQRKIVRTSDGTLHSFINTGSVTMSCDGVSKAGLLWLTSTDNGASWTCQSQLNSNSAYNAFAVADSSDNIYIAYATSSAGGSSANDLLFRKLTKGVSSWTLETAQTVLDATSSSQGYSAPTLAVEGTTRVWLGFRSYNGTNYQTTAYYSDGLSAAPTWTQSLGLDTASPTTTEHIPVFVRFGTKIAAIYSYSTGLKWRYRNDADGLTTWSTEADAITGSTGIVNDKFSVTVDNSNNIHVVSMMNSASSTAAVVRYSFYNGATWSTAVDLATANVFGSALGTASISTDGTGVWVFWSDRTNVLGATDVGKVVYKQGVSPFASGNFDASATALNSDERVFDKVWSYVSSSYSDETTDAASIVTADTQLVSSSGDMVYFGMSEKFRFVNVATSTNGVGGVLAYEYWNGSTWATLTTVGSANPNFTSCTGGGGSVSCGVWFNPPTDWAKTAVNSESAPGYYYVRARVTTNFTTTPVGSQARAMGRLDNISTIAQRAGLLHVMWADNLNSLTPMNVQTASLITGSNVNPENPASLGDTSLVDGSFTADTTPDLSFTLSDQNGADTLKYQIQIDDNSDFGSPVIDYTSALAAQGDTTFTVGQSAGSGTYTAGSASTTLADGSYYWRVKAIDNSATESGFTTANSGSVAFQVDATAPAVPGTPAPQSTPTNDTTPTWTWTASTDVGSGLATTTYSVQWSQSATFSSGNSTSTSTTNSFTHSVSLSNGTWYYRVYASDVIGNNSAYSTTGSVVIDSSLPDTPSSLGGSNYVDGSFGIDPTPDLSFTLSAPNGADQVKYQIQIDDSSDFGSPIVDYTSALAAQGVTTFTVGQSAGSGSYTAGSAATTLTEGAYYWRVKAINSSDSATGFISANSGAVAFQIDFTAPTVPGTPSTSTPTNDTTPTWTWTASTDAGSGLATTTYSVQWSQSATFASGVSSSTSITNSFTHSSGLSNGTWYFRVYASDISGNDSAYSTAGSVEVNSDLPDAPSSLGYATVTTGLTVANRPGIFHFTMGGSLKYQIQIDDSSDFGSPTIDYTAGTSTGTSRQFYVGQGITGGEAGTGGATYAAGSASTTLSAGNYYWRVRAVNPSTSDASAWVNANSGSVAFVVDNSITASTMNLDATYNNIEIELFFRGDSNHNASAAVEYKKSTDSSWKEAMAMWQTDDTIGNNCATDCMDDAYDPAFYSSVMQVESATTYDVRVTITDSDGTNGTSVFTGQITTKTDNIAAASSLTPTRYLSPGGNNSNDGLTAATPWKTIEYAIKTAPANAVVELAPGSYKGGTSFRDQPITFKAQYPAVDDDRNVINSGNHSIIESTTVVGPTGSNDADLSASNSPWEQVSLTGPGAFGATAGASYTVWKFTGTLTANLQHYGMASTRSEIPQRVAYWDRTIGAELNTKEKWAEMMYTNKTYRYGIYQEATTNTVYARLPNDVDPNDYYIYMGGATSNNGNGINVDGPNVRISGIEFRFLSVGAFYGHTTLSAVQNTTDGIFDHNLVVSCLGGVQFFGVSRANPLPDLYGYSHTVQYNRFIDSNTWVQNTPSPEAIPWYFVKDKLVLADGSLSLHGRTGGLAETGAITAKGGSANVVVRYNTIDGYFNGFNASVGYDRHDSYGWDIHDNYFMHGNDDAIEPEGNQVNWRVYNNRMDYYNAALSVSPLQFGPIYFFRNNAWRTGTTGSPKEIASSRLVPGGNTVKEAGTNQNPVGRVYLINNTFWSDETDPKTSDGGKVANPGSNPTSYYLRNNIIRSTRYVFEISDNSLQYGAWNEDYDFMATLSNGNSSGIKIGGVGYYSDVTTYRANGYGGAHTNTLGDFLSTSTVDSNMVAPTSGDVTLSANSALKDLGTEVPTITDGYSGAAPDLGYAEFTGVSANVAPSVPSALGATEYVNGSFGTDTTPDLSFTLSDSNSSDTVKYQIQIDDSSDFGSPIVDYTSALAAQGTKTFTVGQAEGSGSYAAGSASTTLSDGSYYWRVKAIDNSDEASSFTTANSGAIAFKVDTTVPTTPGTPVNTSPTSNTRPIWVWDASADSGSGLAANAYSLRWSTDPSFATVAGSALATSNTYTHTVDLADGTWYLQVKAIDSVGNESAYSSNGTTVVDSTLPNSTPDLPQSLGGASMVNGSYGTDTTPQFSFTLSDPNTDDTLKFQILIDDNSDFGSPIIDYTSALAAPGARTFTVGQAAGTGSYSAGSAATTLSDGNYYWKVRATDNNDEVSSYVAANSGAVAFRIDVTAPTTPGTPSTTTPSNDTTPTWSWTASTDSGSGLASTAYSVQWSQTSDFSSGVSSSTSTTNSFTHTSALTNGTWYFRVRATDNLNNVSSYSSNGSVLIDTTAPSGPTSVTSSDHTASTWSGDATITMTWTAATDSGAGLSGYSYVFDTLSNTVPDTTQDIGSVTTVSSSALSDGNAHYFHIRAQDSLDNWGSAVHAGPFYIDTTAPTTPGVPQTTSPTSNLRPTWTWTASTDSGSGLAANGYSVRWSQSSTFASGVSSSTSTTNSFTHGSDLSDGTWYFQVKSVDALSNQSAFSGTGTVVIDSALDNSAPDIPTDLGGSSLVDGSYGTDTTPQFSFTLSDPDVDDTVKFTIDIDDTADFSSPVVSYTSVLAAQGSASFTVGQAAGSGSYSVGSAATTLSDGNYYWRVKAIDNLSESSAYQTANSENIAFRIDTTTPTVPQNLGLQSASGSDIVSLAWTASTDSSSGIDTYTVQYCDSEDFSGCDANVVDVATNVYVQADPLDEGTWYFRVKAVDLAGNTSAYSDSVSALVDVTAPTTPGTPSTTTPTTNTTPTWTWTASTDAGAGLDSVSPYTVSWCDNSSFSDCANSSTVQTNSFTMPSGLSDGTWYLMVKAVDAVGNQSVSSALGSVVIDSTSPVISALVVTPSDTTSSITWTTDEQASSLVDYGFSTGYGSTTGETDTSPRVTSHSVDLSGLASCTRYYYQISTTDGLDQTAVSAGSFNTTGCIGDAAIVSQTESTIDSAAGGTLSLISGGKGLSLSALAGYYSGDLNFQIKKLDKTAVINALSSPTSLFAVSDHIYDLEALSDISTKVTDFDQPVTITINYSDSDVSGIDESSLAIYHYHLGSWSLLSGCGINTSANTVSCTTTSLSIFGLFGTQSLAQNQSSGNNNSSSSSSNNGGGGSGVCSATAPTAADLFQIDTTSTTAILYVTAPGRYSSYIVTYGYDKSDERFSANIPVNPNLWIVPIQINLLSPSTPYYFTVQAVNDCTPGAKSNVLGIKTLPKNSKQTGKYFKNNSFIQKSYSTVKSGISRITTKPAVPVNQTTPVVTQPSPEVNQPVKQTPVQATPSQPKQTESTSWWGNITKAIKGFFHL